MIYSWKYVHIKQITQGATWNDGGGGGGGGHSYGSIGNFIQTVEYTNH